MALSPKPNIAPTQESCGRVNTAVRGSTTANIVDSMERQHQPSDAELADIVEVVSKSVGQRHPSWRSAFQGIDRNRNGKVSNREARIFFEGYGYGNATADKFFKSL